MPIDTDKPYVLRVAEVIYLKIIDIKKENPEMNNIQAFEVFMTTKNYDLIFQTYLRNINEKISDCSGSTCFFKSVSNN